MKVIHLLWSGRLGGAERSVYQLARHQHRTGTCAVAIGYGRAEGEFAERAIRDGLCVHDFRLHGGLDLLAATRVRRVLQDYSIHHFHGPEAPLVLASLLCRNVRRIYTHRGGLMRYRGKQWMRYRLFGPILRRTFDSVTGSFQAARAVEALFGIPERNVIRTINGIDFDSLSQNKDGLSASGWMHAHSDMIVIGTAANLRRLKRVDWLIRAVAAIETENVRLVVIGDGPDRDRLENLASRVLPSQAVLFTGMVTNIGLWLSVFDIFVLPSGPEEGFGNALIEAMAYGLPVVVCGDSPALVEHVDHGRVGFVAAGVEDMTIHLRTLGHNASLRREIGEAARQRALEVYSMDKVAAGFAQLYSR
jgi:glycosyltransferase involved in cell wall biosynthesis